MSTRSGAAFSAVSTGAEKQPSNGRHSGILPSLGRRAPYMPPMAYPVSDHFDGEHFFNPEPANRTSAPSGRRFGIASFLWNRFVRQRMPEGWSTWPKHVANAVYPPPEGALGTSEIGVTFIGHASFLLRVAG